MAPDLTVPGEDDGLAYDPDSPRDTFWNRIATSKLPAWSKDPGQDTFVSLANIRHTDDSGRTRSTSPRRPSLRPAHLNVERPLLPTRQPSESRDRLTPRQPSNLERKRNSLARRRAQSAVRASPQRSAVPRRSAPEMRGPASKPYVPQIDDSLPPSVDVSKLTLQDKLAKPSTVLPDFAPPVLSPRSSLDDERLSRRSSHASDGLNDPAFWQELDSRWILNLSMAFRDNTEREKFFITYAEEPNRWRRVTVSVDYRDKPPDSLEADLKTLPFQRDKSAHIYEAIHESLPSVQFFDSVTNLKLETSDGRLHVHVTKDENEIIKYPSIDAVAHLDLGLHHEVLESDIHFQSHLSGFVYKVSVHGKSCIKKEIPGPDMIDEFLYEVNALWNLRDSPYVIDFCAIVLDDERTCIKGLLISYADKGTLVDIIYDHRDPPIPWARRDKWAKQIVSGLAEIHEYGFVQGDFTLSNIVIDSSDNARIIDINRRGCPVGWEPPEFQGLIGSGQRISMYIGTKSDLYQLGMVLWAIAEMDDEPERAVDTLTLENTQSGAPTYLVDWTTSCLADNPKDRLAAKDLLGLSSKSSATFATESLVNLDLNDTRPNASTSKNNGNDQRTQPYNEDIDNQAHYSSQRELQHEDGNVVTTKHMHHLHSKADVGHTAASRDRRFMPPQHMDSGLPGEDEDTRRLGPPLHQDSGIVDDSFLTESLDDPELYAHAPRSSRRFAADPVDFAHFGGHLADQFS